MIGNNNCKRVLGIGTHFTCKPYQALGKLNFYCLVCFINVPNFSSTKNFFSNRKIVVIIYSQFLPRMTDLFCIISTQHINLRAVEHCCSLNSWSGS